MTEKRSTDLYLEDILESIEKIEVYLNKVNRESFNKDTQLQDSVIRRLEIIGEAARQIVEDFKKKYPEIPWKSMAGMRDMMIHGYAVVNLKRVWNTVKQDLPKLKVQIRQIIQSKDEKVVV